MGIDEGPFQNITSLFIASEATDLEISIHASGASGVAPDLFHYNVMLGSVQVYLTLLDGEWVDVVDFDFNVKDAIAAALIATASPTNGWNDVISSAGIVVTRVSSTVVMIETPHVDAYFISGNEVVEFYAPDSALKTPPANPLKGYPSINIIEAASPPAGSYGDEIWSLVNFSTGERLVTRDDDISDAEVHAMIDEPRGIWTIPACGFKFDVRACDYAISVGAESATVWVGGTTLTSCVMQFEILHVVSAPRLAFVIRPGGNYNGTGNDFWTDRGAVDDVSLVSYKTG